MDQKYYLRILIKEESINGALPKQFLIELKKYILMTIERFAINSIEQDFYIQAILFPTVGKVP